MNLKKIGKVFTSKFARNGSSSYKKRIYQAAVSQSLRNTAIDGVPHEKDYYTPYTVFIKAQLHF